MTLQELGYQYLAQETQLRKRLKELRRLPEAQTDPLLRRRIYYLMTEAADCRKTGRYLVSYYDREVYHG